MSKWIHFNKIKKPPERKTDIYEVLTKDESVVLGMVQWYGPWRCYSFMPSGNCVFEKQCLRDIADFVDKLMIDRKK